MTLTEKQRCALWEKDGTYATGFRIVSARPGTGKTTTLTDYCVDIADNWDHNHAAWQGIAAVSYTNVAKDELERKAQAIGRAGGLLSEPHFVGTIDSFLNRFVFLPFGAKCLGETQKRPRLVGEPYGPWRPTYQFCKARDDKTTSSPIFFDCYTLDRSGSPVRVDKSERRISASQSRQAEDVSSQNAHKIANMKRYVWRDGRATQADANYFSYVLLRESAALTQALIRRFPVLVIDEAQDMTEVQHAIIDHLKTAGHKHIVLVGDEYQAIYEWNTARPQLFTDKVKSEDWTDKTIDQTFRCGPAVCSVLDRLTDNGVNIAPVASSKNEAYGDAVTTREYNDKGDWTDSLKVIDELAASLADKSPHDGDLGGENTLAVLAHSRNVVARLRTLIGGGTPPNDETLELKTSTTRDFLRVAHNLDQNDLFGAVTAYETLLTKVHDYDSKKDMRTAVASFQSAVSVSPAAYRTLIFNDLMSIRRAMPTSGAQVSAYQACCKVSLNAISTKHMMPIADDCASLLTADKRAQDRPLASVFTDRSEREDFLHPAYRNVRLTFSTIHGVKGETYDGVLLFLRSKSKGCGCEPSKAKWAEILRHDLIECEAKRVLYVAMSRAAQTLRILTPTEQAPTWQGLVDPVESTLWPDGLF